MDISYAIEPELSPAEFIEVLQRSGLGARRPVNDERRIRIMLANASLVLTARAAGRLVGACRALTDFSYCCYVSDLAVDRDYQGQRIGRALLEMARSQIGPQSMCLLLSAPDAVGFYEHIGMTPVARGFMFPRER